MSLEYILQNPTKIDNRAKAYKIGYHKQQINSVDQENLSEQERILLSSALSYHEHELELEELQEILIKFNELQNQDKRDLFPNGIL